MSLIDVCYEQIKGNFWYGLFGDFKLIIDKETGYFNATKLCASGGKRFKKWLENNQSRELISDLTTEKADARIRTAVLYEIHGDNNDIVTSKTTGTYVCDDLILAIASWISTKFYIKCNKIIKDYFIEDFKRDNRELQERLADVEEKMGKLELENSKLKIDMTKPTSDQMKHPQFILIKKNNEKDLLPYYVIRRQKESRDSRLSEIEEYFPDYEIVLAFTVKNGVTIYNKLKESGKIKCDGNHFSTQLSKEKLIRLILYIHSGEF